MAVEVINAGLATIKTGTGASNALETLGYTADGAEVESRAMFLDVEGDENGGTAGPPIEIQYMGEIAVVRLRLTKVDAAVLTKVESRLLAGTAGTPGTAGTFMFSGAKTIRLLIHSVAIPRNFPRAFLRGPIQKNYGTKYMQVYAEFECHKDGSGQLWNSTTA